MNWDSMLLTDKEVINICKRVAEIGKANDKFYSAGDLKALEALNKKS